MSIAKTKTKKILFKIIRVLGYLWLSFIGLFMVIALLIQVPAIQNKIVQEATSFLTEKIGTPVSIGHISLKFPKSLLLNDIYVEDQQADTLVYIGRLHATASMFKLFNKTIELNEVNLNNVTSNISRGRDSIFNFDYIINAFSQPQDTTSADTTSEWNFSISDVSLTQTSFQFLDSLGHNVIKAKLKELTLEMDEVDFVSQLYHVDDFFLNGLEAHVQLNGVSEPSQVAVASNEESMPDISFSTIHIQNSKAHYRSDGIELVTAIENFRVEANVFNLLQKEIDIESIALSNSMLDFKQSKHPVPEDSTIEQTQGAQDQWKISLEEIDLENNSILYAADTLPKKSGLDFNHLNLSNLTLRADNIVFREADWRIDIQQFALQEQSGFFLQQAEGKIAVNNKQAEINDFLLKTKASQIRVEGIFEFESLAGLEKNLDQMTVDAALVDSYIGWQDVLFFNSQILDSVPVLISPTTQIRIDTEVTGKVNSLWIHALSIQGFEDTSLKAKGKIDGLPTIEKTTFNITLEEFHTTKNDINEILIDSLIPKNINLPEAITLTGDFSGTIHSPKVNMILSSDMGGVKLAASYHYDSLSKLSTYNGGVSVEAFQIGKLINQPAMGVVTLKASANGSGLTLEEIDAQIKGAVEKFEFNDYTYSGFTIDGKLVQSVFTGEASLNDPNLSFTLNGDLDYNIKEQITPYKFTFQLKHADFKALHLTERPLRARFGLDVNLESIDVHNLNGSVDIRDVALYNGEDLYTVDSLLFISLTDSLKSELTINSDLFDGKFSGSFDLFSLPDVLKEYFDTYYKTSDKESTVASTRAQYFNFDLNIRNTSLITDILLPDLKRFEPETIHGEFDSDSKTLNMEIKINKLEYGSIHLDNFLLEATSDPSVLKYAISVENLKVSIAQIPYLEFSGDVSKNVLSTNLILYDSLHEMKYDIRGNFQNIEGKNQLQLAKEIMLNYETWLTPEGNYLQFGEKGMVANRFELVHNNQSIKLNTQVESDSVVMISLEKLTLTSLSGMVSSDSLLSGLVDANIKFYSAQEAGSLEATIHARDVAFNNTDFGDIRIKVDRSKPTQYDLSLKMEGPDTDISVSGDYTTNESDSKINLQADVKSLNLALVKALSFGNVKEASGNLSGKIVAKGELSRPELTGDLRFNNTEITPTFLSSKLYIDKETISFTPTSIRFKGFEIKDKQKNSLLIDGNVGMKSLNPDDLDLRIKADNFLILNTTASDNNLFYGVVRLNTSTRVRGTVSKPKVDMQISLSDGSDLTYVVPQSGMGVLERKGIVEFVDKDAQKDPFLASIQRDIKKSTDTVSTFSGIELTANIELSNKETFNIVLNPVTEDKLTVKGNSTLTLDIDPTGNMNLTGRYELTEGTYNFSFYKLVKREFAINKGSVITWSGDPLDAALDITAEFEVDAAPINLIQTTDANELDQYKERLPFIVYLMIKGNLLTPDISFKLDMPARNQGAFGGRVYARILDINSRESELNKQVFALVILKQFIGDDPFQGQGGVSLSNTARTSVSQILSEQLNRLSKNIEGVELNFDIKSYEGYENGESQNNTDLQLGISKTLLDDRLVVKLSGNVNLEGQQNQQKALSDYVGDIAIEYKLTEDGRIRITGFRNSDYDMIDGELYETGVGVIYVKDYNSLKELFQFKKKDKRKEEDIEEEDGEEQK